MDSYDKILIGASIPLMETDEEQDDFYLDQKILSAEIDADFESLIENFGTENFKILFLNLYNEILSLDLKKQRELCEKLNTKISEKEDFEFFPPLDFNNYLEVKNFLDFLQFINFNYINFLSLIISGLDFDLLRKDLNKFFSFNWKIIFSRIETYVDENELITFFLRTNNKENLFDFVKLRLEKDKMLVILQSIERELK